MIDLDILLESYSDVTFLKADGFDKAILGVDDVSMKLIYSTSKCIEILMEQMTEEEAIEYFEFNVSGAYVGEKTPIWCNDFF